MSRFEGDCSILQQLAEDVSADEADGMHVMFGMVVVPFVKKLIESGYKDKTKKAFRFIERMAIDENPEIAEVLEFTVLEGFISYGKQFLDECKFYMGKEPLTSCEFVEKYMM